MPEIASIPILSATSPSVSSTSAPGAAAAPSGIAGAGTAATSGYAGADSNLPQGQGHDTFANILKRQIDQPASAAGTTTATATVGDHGLPAASVSLIADLVTNLPLNGASGLAAQLAAGFSAAQQSSTSAAETTQPSGQDDKAALLALLAGSPGDKPDNSALHARAVATQAALAALAADGSREKLAAEASAALAGAEGAPTEKLSATQLASALFSLKSGSDLSGKGGALTGHAIDQDKAPTQTQDVTDSSLAALLAFFPPPTPASPTNTSKADPSAIAAASDQKSGGMMQAQFLALQQSAQNKEGDVSTLQADPAEMPTAAPGKAAEFAASQAVSAEIEASAKGKDGPRNEVSFDNALAAAHAQIVNHGHDRDIRTPANANNPIKVETPLGASGWDHEVGESLVWMVGRQEQRAELVLNPPQLGRVEVSLSMNGDQTSATFVSANPAVRDALESALPRLREMFADAGLSLGQAQVGADSGNNAANQSSGNRENGDNSSRFSNALDGTSEGNMSRLTGTSQWVRHGRGLVDVFA